MSWQSLASISEGEPLVGGTWLGGLRSDPNVGRPPSAAGRHVTGEADAPPLGYDVKDRKLVINEAEADTIRMIFHRYGGCDLSMGFNRPGGHDLRALRRQGRDWSILSSVSVCYEPSYEYKLVRPIFPIALLRLNCLFYFVELACCPT